MLIDKSNSLPKMKKAQNSKGFINNILLVAVYVNFIIKITCFN